MIYFEDYEKAAAFASKNSKYNVVNMKDNPSKGNQWIWAVRVL